MGKENLTGNTAKIEEAKLLIKNRSVPAKVAVRLSQLIFNPDLTERPPEMIVFSHFNVDGMAGINITPGLLTEDLDMVSILETASPIVNSIRNRRNLRLDKYSDDVHRACLSVVGQFEIEGT